MTVDPSPVYNPMAAAHHAPRCQHVKINGGRCEAPARRGQRFCHFHQPRPDYNLPTVEDYSSLLLALMQTIRALHDKAIDPTTCALTLRMLQIAGCSLKAYRQEISPYDEDMAEVRAYEQTVRIRQDLEEQAANNPKFAALLEAATRLLPEELPPHAEIDSPTLEANAS